MKIRPERKLMSCPDRLRCVICRQRFEAPKIRHLLYSDRGLIQGDVCSSCLKLKPNDMKQKLKEQSLMLLKPAAEGSWSAGDRQLALDLLKCLQEDIELPTRYNWLLKRIEILTQETQELETARLGLSNCRCGRKMPVRIVFKDDKKDNKNRS